ncbi:MAG TPA: helix-turn-helix domain-containing protein [Gemmatimonadales bacterium]|jgi:AraC-like DNA-binding protein
MPATILLLAGPRARAALRRALPRGRARLVSCRAAPQLERLLQLALADAVIVDVKLPGARELLASCRAAFPHLPRFAYSAFRPDDGELLRICVDQCGAVPIVEGVEDAVLAELVLPLTASASRESSLASAPRLLRLVEPIQERAWREVLRRVGGPIRAADIARALKVSREHLSRQFGAGGAPNIKRVIDLARTATAADLLANPGYSVRTVARILRFSSASHLSGSARRVAGVTAAELPGLGPRGVLAAFMRGRTRSRLAVPSR